MNFIGRSSLQFCTIYCEINKNYGRFLIIQLVQEKEKKRENMATNKYITIIIIFIRGFGQQNLLFSTRLEIGFFIGQLEFSFPKRAKVQYASFISFCFVKRFPSPYSSFQMTDTFIHASPYFFVIHSCSIPCICEILPSSTNFYFFLFLAFFLLFKFISLKA